MESEPQVSSESSNTEKRNRISRSTCVIITLFVLAWLVVAIPGQKTSVSAKSSRSQTIQEFGWPFVHATRLHVPALVYSKLGKVAPNPVSPTSELMDECLWGESGVRRRRAVSSSYYLRKLAAPTQLRWSAECNWGIWKDGTFHRSRYWTDLGNWKYWGERSLLKWDLAGLAMNLICFAITLASLSWLLERRLRRRGKWYRVSLFEFMAMQTALVLVIGYLVWECRSGRSHLELAEELKARFNSDAVVQYRPPTWLAKLADGMIGTTGGSYAVGRVPEGLFRSIVRVKVNGLVDKNSRVFDVAQFTPILQQKEVAGAEDVSMTFHTKSQQELLKLWPPLRVKSLQLEFRRNQPVEKLPDLQVLQRFENLEVLDLNHYKFENFEAPKLPQLQGLKLSDCKSQEQVGRWLTTLPHLKGLWEIGGTVLVEHLDQLPASLEILQLAVKNEALDVSALGRLKNLRVLSVSSIRPGSERPILTNLPDLPQLKSLSLIRVGLSEDLPQCWQKALNDSDP